MVRFCVEINKIAKELFRIKEIKNYTELNITFNGGTKSCIVGKDVNSFDELFNSKKVEKSNKINQSSHITVHANPNNEENNTIKRTIAYADSAIDDSTMVQVTPGIKRDNKFIPIIFRISGDLRRTEFNLSSNSKDVIKYMYKNFKQDNNQLKYMIVISKSEIQFHYNEEHPSNIIEYKFKNYNVTVIYSVLNVKPLEQTISMTLTTRREDYNNLKGYEWYQIYDLYTEFTMMHANGYFKVNKEL